MTSRIPKPIMAMLMGSYEGSLNISESPIANPSPVPDFKPAPKKSLALKNGECMDDPPQLILLLPALLQVRARASHFRT